MESLTMYSIAYKTEQPQSNHEFYTDPITGECEFYSTEEKANNRLKFLELQHPGRFNVIPTKWFCISKG